MTYLTTREDIHPDRIGALGMCASGGYVPYAAQTGHRIRSIATVSAADMGSVIREGLGRTQDPADFRAMLDRAGEQRRAEARGAAPTDGGLAARQRRGTAADRHPATSGDFAYYRTPRGHHPRANREWVQRSVDLIAQYDSYAMIRIISPRPLLMITGSEAETAYFSREAIEKAAEPKRLVVIDGATHVDLYDRNAYVTPAVAELTALRQEPGRLPPFSSSPARRMDAMPPVRSRSAGLQDCPRGRRSRTGAERRLEATVRPAEGVHWRAWRDVPPVVVHCAPGFACNRNVFRGG
ncbi:alpha/beta hydrolase [Streptomyces sp. NPDC058534]|uniref:alpha/beta hydrolase n=1 Tax=Streptomyces sp. NPDC058534 TaxID=3346541 RepID=UPI003651192E